MECPLTGFPRRPLHLTDHSLSRSLSSLLRWTLDCPKSICLTSCCANTGRFRYTEWFHVSPNPRRSRRNKPNGKTASIKEHHPAFYWLSYYIAAYFLHPSSITPPCSSVPPAPPTMTDSSLRTTARCPCLKMPVLIIAADSATFPLPYSHTGWWTV